MKLLVPLADAKARSTALETVGGISLLRRTVRLAERAGYEDVRIDGHADDELRAAVEGTRAAFDTASVEDGATVVVDAGFVPTQAWLEAARGDASVRDAPQGRWARTAEERRTLENDLIRGLVKDTEGFMSRHVERPISLSISRHLMSTSITPNQMTWISLLIGVVGGACFALPGRGWALTGALLFLAHSILDGCDGELARLKLQESRWGGVLDFWGDNVVHAAVFLGIGLGWARDGGGALPLVLAAFAVVGTFVSAGLVYAYTMRERSGKGPMYESVSREAEKSRLAKIADALSRRDFIYLVVILAALGKIHVFLVLSALGAPAYALTLLAIRRAESPDS